MPATFDLSALRRQDDRARLPLRDRRRRTGQDPDALAGLFVDEITLTAGGTTVFTDGAEAGDNGWTLTASRPSARPRRRCTTTTTSPPTGSTCPTTATCSPGRTTSGSRVPARLVEHFPYQDGLLVSCWDTQFTDNNRARTPARARSCRSTRIRIRSTASTAPPGAGGSRRTTRRSRSRRPTRSRSTCSRRAGQLHPGPGRAAGVRRSPVVLVCDAAARGREGAERRREHARPVAGRHVDAGARRLDASRPRRPPCAGDRARWGPSGGARGAAFRGCPRGRPRRRAAA